MTATPNPEPTPSELEYWERKIIEGLGPTPDLSPKQYNRGKSEPPPTGSPFAGGQSKRIFLPSANSFEWQKLASKPGRQWKRGFSAESASACWEAAGDKLPPEITAAFDSSSIPELRDLNLLAAMPKWQTHLPDDKRPSTTDILAVARNDDGLCVISVEARENENFGPVVAERLTRKNGQPNERLRFLQDFLSLPSVVDPKVRYELLFRAASALVAARQFFASTAVMLIHSFGRRPELRAEFEKFCDAMGALEPSSNLREVKRFEKPRLILAWVDGDRRFAPPFDTRPRPEGIVTVTFGPCCGALDPDGQMRAWVEEQRS